MLKEEKLITNKEVKSSAFAAYFGEPENAAKLFEALEPGVKVLPEEIDFTTLNGVLFMARKNDLAFTVKKKVLVISEHQALSQKSDKAWFSTPIKIKVIPMAAFRMMSRYLLMLSLSFFSFGFAITRLSFSSKSEAFSTSSPA